MSEQKPDRQGGCRNRRRDFPFVICHLMSGGLLHPVAIALGSGTSGKLTNGKSKMENRGALINLNLAPAAVMNLL